jgi:hypothetical protein
MIDKNSFAKNFMVNISPEDLPFADALNGVFDYLPRRRWVFLPYSVIPLSEVGFSPERIREVICGSPPNDEERDSIRWAVKLTKTVSETVSKINTENELDLIIKAGKIAGKKLNDESAVRVLNSLRRLMTETPLIEYYLKRKEEIGRIIVGSNLT